MIALVVAACGGRIEPIPGDRSAPADVTPAAAPAPAPPAAPTTIGPGSFWCGSSVCSVESDDCCEWYDEGSGVLHHECVPIGTCADRH